MCNVYIYRKARETMNLYSNAKQTRQNKTQSIEKMKVGSALYIILVVWNNLSGNRNETKEKSRAYMKI